MAYASYKVSVPGSIMLLGEHAVLYGHKAIACAIDQRMTLELVPRADLVVDIRSDRLGEYNNQLNSLQVVKPFEFILAAIIHYRNKFPSGFSLTINSQFSEKIGLGSSAAVTVAMVTLLNHWLSIPCEDQEIFSTGLSIIRSVQGFGSGADLAASLCGGIIALQPEPLQFQSLSCNLPIALIYSGYKTATVEVVNRVQQTYEKRPTLVTRIFNAMAECTEIGLIAIQQQNLPLLAKIFTLQQNLMGALGVSDATLDKIIAKLNHHHTLLGAKISGSGLGDCIVALTTPAFSPFVLSKEWQAAGIRWIKGKIDQNGVQKHDC